MSMAVDQTWQKSGIAQIHNFRPGWDLQGSSRSRNLVILNQDHGVRHNAARVYIQHARCVKRDYLTRRVLLRARHRAQGTRTPEAKSEAEKHGATWRHNAAITNVCRSHQSIPHR